MEEALFIVGSSFGVVRLGYGVNNEKGLSNQFSVQGGGRGGTPHMKGEGMLVVSLRGVNFEFWSYCVLGKTQSYLVVKVSFRVAREKIQNIYIVCVLKWSLLGVKKKSLGHAQIGLL